MANPEWLKIRKTRFRNLGYTQFGPGCWRVLDISDRDNAAPVGREYATKTELLANLETYAAEYGCEEAIAKVPLTSSTLCMQVTRYKDAIFMPLPPELWRRIDSGPANTGCSCHFCRADGTGGYWDTLVVGKDAPKNANDFSYTVHNPGLHPEHIRKRFAYTPENIRERLESLRGELRAERISYGELAELQSLVAFIPADDDLMEAAGGTGAE